MTWTANVFCVRHCAVEFAKLPTKERPRHTRNGNTYTPKRTETAEKAIRSAWIETNGLTYAGFDGPLRIHVDVWRQTPQRQVRRDEGKQDINMPDLDNTAKLVMDALNNVAYVDDKQVVSLTVLRHVKQKRNSPARVEVEVQYLAEHES